MWSPSLADKTQGARSTSAAERQHSAQHSSATTKSSPQISSTSTISSFPTDVKVTFDKSGNLHTIHSDPQSSLHIDFKSGKRRSYLKEQLSSRFKSGKRLRSSSSDSCLDSDKRRQKQHPRRIPRRTESLDRGKEAFEEHWTDDCLDLGPLPIKETDPKDTRSLWHAVRNIMPKEPKGLKKKSIAAESSKKDNNGEGTASEKRFSPYSADFNDRILAPRSIAIETGGMNLLAHSHFGSKQPANGMTQGFYYAEHRGAPDIALWVEVDDEFLEKVTQNYERMRRTQLCEEEFASFAKENLLKQDANLLKNPQKRVWKPVRMLQLVTKPEAGTLWEAPPVIEGAMPLIEATPSKYAFNLRPDCSYWLNLQAFNPDYVDNVENLTYVRNEEIICPYLTTEFKKDDHTEKQAQLQVAAAGSLALYNRYRLRHERLRLQEKGWNSSLQEVIRHYGLTFSGSHYMVWVIEPIPFEHDWVGCTMRRLANGFCNKANDLRKLIHWINEIHCWGVTVHAPRCEKDIKLSLETNTKTSGQRTSNVQPDSEDEADSDVSDEQFRGD